MLSPRRAKISEKRAVSPATTRSHTSARLAPAPTATPRTLATVGCGSRCNARQTSPTWRIAVSWCLPGSADPPPWPDDMSPTSAPLQNSPPAPVITTARSSALPAIARISVSNSSHIGPLIAFLRSGRRRVMVTTPSRRSTVIVSSSRVSAVMRADDTDDRGIQPVPEVPGAPGRLRTRRGGAGGRSGLGDLGVRRLSSERGLDHVDPDAGDRHHVETDLGSVHVVGPQPFEGEPADALLLRTAYGERGRRRSGRCGASSLR